MSAIGFSTGAIAFGDFRRALWLLEATRANAVELSALRSAELAVLLSALPELMPDLLARYDYVSFHAPTDFQDEETLVSQLELVAGLDMNIIVHPDTIQDIRLWRRLGKRLCLENMDSRKHIGRTVEELARFYDELPDASLCFDIAHARQFDATMTEAVRIAEVFRERLAQVHLSEVNSQGKHFSMSYAAKKAYEPFADILASVPIIVESVVKPEFISYEIDETYKLLESGGDSRGFGISAPVANERHTAQTW